MKYGKEQNPIIPGTNLSILLLPLKISREFLLLSFKKAITAFISRVKPD